MIIDDADGVMIESYDTMSPKKKAIFKITYAKEIKQYERKRKSI